MSRRWCGRCRALLPCPRLRRTRLRRIIRSKVYAIDASGAKLWEYLTEGKMISSPAIGADGMVYVGSGDGKRLRGQTGAARHPGVQRALPWPMFHHDRSHTGRMDP
ncbi:MAG: PQQ-binding-like beta-propeller repeat protein [Thiogranum sp.]